MTERLIRSRYRRRLLRWLSRPGTVSRYRREGLGIHIPHASTHMKALREVGWIHRLEDGGARGAMHSIAPDGIDALSMDAKVRVQLSMSLERCRRGPFWSSWSKVLIWSLVTPWRRCRGSFPSRCSHG